MIDARKSRMVKLRYFGWLSAEETAEVYESPALTQAYSSLKAHG
jgi:hypothetical protein